MPRLFLSSMIEMFMTAAMRSSVAGINSRQENSRWCSACRVLQALPLVASGASERWQLSDEELAVARASHGGEPRHVATATAILAKAGVSTSALECGTHWPYHDGSIKALAAAGQEPTALNNNCSGKHAGFVCLGCCMAEDRDRRAFLRV